MVIRGDGGVKAKVKTLEGAQIDAAGEIDARIGGTVIKGIALRRLRYRFDCRVSPLGAGDHLVIR